MEDGKPCGAIRRSTVTYVGIDIMDTIAFLLITLILIVMPPIAVRRSLVRQATGFPAWLHPALSLIGPFIAAFVLVVLIWLPGYSGQCGGWLGETTPCSGFGQFAAETMYWAAISMAMPGVLGMLLGAAVLIVGLIRRGLSGPGG